MLSCSSYCLSFTRVFQDCLRSYVTHTQHQYCILTGSCLYFHCYFTLFAKLFNYSAVVL